jgi:hypothetical protein
MKAKFPRIFDEVAFQKAIDNLPKRKSKRR